VYVLSAEAGSSAPAVGTLLATKGE